MRVGLLLLFGIFFQVFLQAQQIPGAVLDPNIKTVQLHMYGDQEGYPVYRLNSNDKMELHFDDLSGGVKSYYYSYQLCDFNWEPVNLSAFDYIKGFTQQRISTYRLSSIAFQRYTHYQATLPDANSMPSRSGNYLLKVYPDGDTSRTILVLPFLVVEPKASISAQVVQPFTPQYFRTHQRVKFTVNVDGMNAFNPSQMMKVKVLQNYRWDQAQGTMPPTFIRGSNLEYNNENNLVFEGGKEWRWLDLRSFRLLSDRIDSAANTATSFHLIVKPDIDRHAQKYMYYQDLNGLFMQITYETINPYWQADYAQVDFSFVPPSGTAYSGKELYLYGALTNYQLNESTRLRFDAGAGRYRLSRKMKQGYYSYTYLLIDPVHPENPPIELEGNNWETENVYTVLVYYKGFADQCDRLIGVSKINTRTDRPGFSF